MFTISPQLSKTILAFLLLIPWFTLYQKILFPHFAQTGFDGQIILLAEIIFISFVVIFGQHPRLTKNGAYLLAAITFWHISGFTSAYLSEHFHASLIKQIEYLIHCMFAYCVWVFLRQTQKQERMAWFLIFTFVWAIYYIYCAWHVNEDAFNHNWVQGTPMFNNIRHLGYLQTLILPFLLLPLLSEQKSKYIVIFSLLSIFWASVFWSGTRSTFITSLLISAFICLYFKNERKNLSILFISSLIVGLLIALQFKTNSASMDPLRLFFLSSDISEDVSVNSLSSGRLDIWIKLFSETMSRSPWLGLGANPYAYIYPMINSSVSQAHNTFIQMLSATGLIGVSLLAVIFFYTLKIWITSKANLLTMLARISIIGVCFNSLMDGHFYHTFSLVLVMITLALSFHSQPDNQNRKSLKKHLLPSIIIILVPICIYPLQKHWETYIQQQFQLEFQEQIDIVAGFPSYYRPTEWIYNEQSKPNLRQAAIKFGQQHGPRFCSYYLFEFMEANSEKQLHLSRNLKKYCSTSELAHTNNDAILKLINIEDKE